MKLKPDVTMDEMFDLANAMIHLRFCQRQLHWARAHRMFQTDYENSVCSALDRLWEAQQSAA